MIEMEVVSICILEGCCQRAMKIRGEKGKMDNGYSIDQLDRLSAVYISSMGRDYGDVMMYEITDES